MRSNRTTSNRKTWLLKTWLLCALAVAAIGVSPGIAQDALFQSRQITPTGEYTFGIEGPAVDARGNLYVVNFGKPGTIGKVAAGASQSELFGVLPEGSVGNSIRFDREGRMFVADYKKHNVFLVSADGKDVKTYFHSDDFNQPNDLTVAADGTIYASDPHWKLHDGQIWRISKSATGEAIGEKMIAERRMSTTNGIDLSPDGKTLYVGESDTREIWAYRIDGTRLLAPRLVKRFADFDIDGLRSDTDGNLFVARILKGTIAELSPQGKLKREIPLTAPEPTNLAFGGTDGKTIFVTQRKGGFVESFRTDHPGREFCLRGCAWTSINALFGLKRGRGSSAPAGTALTPHRVSRSSALAARSVPIAENPHPSNCWLFLPNCFVAAPTTKQFSCP